jgi:hypothetical protein
MDWKDTQPQRMLANATDLDLAILICYPQGPLLRSCSRARQEHCRRSSHQLTQYFTALPSLIRHDHTFRTCEIIYIRLQICVENGPRVSSEASQRKNF